MSAPNRGSRKCGSCVYYTDKQEEWKAGCKLDLCECRSKDEQLGIALCQNYRSQTFIDTSNHHDIGGYPTGYCEWKCPPILRKITWDQWGYRLVSAEGSWCHCWEPIQDFKPLDGKGEPSIAASSLALLRGAP